MPRVAFLMRLCYNEGMITERTHGTQEELQDYSGSRDLPPLDMGLFDKGVTKFPIDVSLDNLSDETKKTLLGIIDDFEQAALARQEAAKFRLGAIKEQYLDLANGLSEHATMDLGALLNLSQRDSNGGVPPQLLVWRKTLRENGAQWKERMGVSDVPVVAPQQEEQTYEARPYQSAHSGRDAAAGDYGD